MVDAAPHTLVVVACATTGHGDAGSRLLELAALRLDESLRPVDRLTIQVRAGSPTRLGNAGSADPAPPRLADVPTFRQVWPRIAPFVADGIVIGHDIDTGLDVLAHELDSIGGSLRREHMVDTRAMALLLLPELDDHGLDALADTLHLPPPGERAETRAETTAGLLVRLADRLADLTPQERRLLETAGWRPLMLLGDGPRRADRRDAPAEAERTTADDRPPRLEVDAEGWRRAFGADGGLAYLLPGFRPRPGQVALAEEVAGRLEHGGVGLFEAGTGMGKSLAYLVPAAFHATGGGRRVIVSTRTKALQRQLAGHELPVVGRLLPDGWRWAVLMGRDNYVCRRRLDAAAEDVQAALPDTDRALAIAYLLCRSRLGDVDLSSLPLQATRSLPALAGVAGSVASSAAACLRRRCPTRGHCPWRTARARAAASHLVCVNHALLLRGPGALPEYEDLVVDEAHLLSDEAESALSREVGSTTLDELRRDLRGRHRSRPLASRLEAALRDVDGERATAAAAVLARAADALPLHEKALAAALAGLVATDPDDRDDGYARAVWLRAGLRERPEWEDFAAACGQLADLMGELADLAASCAELLPEDHRDLPDCLAVAEAAASTASLLVDVQEPTDPATVCWAELEPASGHRTGRWTLTAAPLSPAAGLRTALWERLRSAVLLSATLTTAGSFRYYRRQAGLDADVEVLERVLPSPFDYRRQALLVLEHDPSRPYDGDAAAARQGERLARLIAASGARLLALFTSRRHMEAVAAAVASAPGGDEVAPLVQNVHGSAASLAREFRRRPGRALFGVDTLWTGQDFPGDALVCLVIARLPFPRLSPLVRARRQAAEEEGLDWFRDFYLPEAILRFRQGSGRLIRSEDDRGVVVVLDPRLTQKRYGADFLRSLPEMDVVRAAPDDLPDLVAVRLRDLGALDDGR